MQNNQSSVEKASFQMTTSTNSNKSSASQNSNPIQDKLPEERKSFMKCKYTLTIDDVILCQYHWMIR